MSPTIGMMRFARSAMGSLESSHSRNHTIKDVLQGDRRSSMLSKLAPAVVILSRFFSFSVTRRSSSGKNSPHLSEDRLDSPATSISRNVVHYVSFQNASNWAFVDILDIKARPATARRATWRLSKYPY
ncbi:hypothetical protein [Tritonibacter mobilis]|uniref:hypothetical protein n=1 Tax=Tritonibacter mobilis TaxID=379347 RepID=UPI001CD98F36|nr:hypothetical protein [Tritonibacter mobilis]MCA2008310.1 hypothetical protein [Tritonibacter mobilis]